MAWNRPSNDGRANTPGSHGSSDFASQSSLRLADKRRRRSLRPTLIHGLIGAAVVVIGAAVVWYFLPEQTVRPIAKPNDAPRRIKEVRPALPKTNIVREVLVKPIDPNARPTKIGEKVNGYVMLPSGRIHRVKGVTVSNVITPSWEDKIFECPSDRDIASLMLIAPGAEILGDSSDYYDDFEKSFRESLKTPIIISSNDGPDERLIKESVIAVRNELKQLLDAGKDIAAVMRETREQLRELGLYREELQNQVNDIMAKDGEMSAKDQKDLIDAANLMLKERDVAPIELDSAILYQLKKESISDNESKVNASIEE